MAANSNQRGTSGKKMTAQQRESRKRMKIIIFAVEIVVILLMLLGLYKLMKHTDKEGNTTFGLSSTESEGPSTTQLDKSNLEISSTVEENEAMKGYKNIALFGVDAKSGSRNDLYKSYRSDSTMIASINLDTGDIKLVSVYRDTYLNIGTDRYEKCNAAYARGGAEQAVKMLNMNLDMDIEDFVTVSYTGLKEVIDGLGGVYIDVDSEELKYINDYQISICQDLGWSYTPVTTAGYQLLDGLQASAYCRIRYTAGDDFKRAERQREVLKAIEAQAKKADLATLTKVFNTAISDVYTSIDSDDILELIGNIANYQIVEEGGFPEASMRTTANVGSVGDSVIPRDLESNVVWLHEFLFNDANYQVSDNVKEYGSKITQDTTPYILRNN